MHPPQFLLSQLLSDWPDCILEMRCVRCNGRSMTCAVKGLMRWYGNCSFAVLLSRLKCKFCRRAPSPVYLCASPHRVFSDGPTPDWSIEIVPAPRGLKCS